jgi:biotin transporter BioY
MAYPLVAFVAGWIYEKFSARSTRRFAWAALSSAAAELVLFAGGLGWLALETHSIATAIRLGLYWFIFAEVIKVLMAASVAGRWSKRVSQS